MAGSEKNKEELDSVLQCSICLSEYSKPKQLPCLHTFCRDCLEKYFVESIVGDKTLCPLCKNEFDIPQGVVEELPDNELVIQLILDKRLREEKPKLATNDLRFDMGVKIKDEAVCKVDVEKRLESEMLQKNCIKHKDKEVELYCCDCDLFICRLCHATDHSKHICKVPYEVAEERKKVVQKYTEDIQQYLDESLNQLKKLSEERRYCSGAAREAESDVIKSITDIGRRLKANEIQLLEKFGNMQKTESEEIESKRDAVKTRCAELKSFLDYGTLVVQRGTDCEIIRAADDLHRRAEELIKAENESNGNVGLLSRWMKFLYMHSPSVESIKKLAVRVYSIENWVTAVFGGHEIIFSGNEVKGVTVVDDEIFVIRNGQKHVNVYNLHSLGVSREISIPDFKLPSGIAGCAYNRALYMGDLRDKPKCSVVSVVHRVDLTNDSITHWTLKDNYEVWDFSITAEHTVLLTAVSTLGTDKSRLWEYTTEGQQLRVIKLEESITKVWQGVKLSSDRFIICHGHGLGPNRVCMVNAEGQIIKSYGRERGRGKGLLSVPLKVAIDYRPSSRQVFVADCGNCRVMKFDTDLSYVSQIYAPRDLNSPCRLCFDPSTEKLIIGEHSGRVIVFSSK